MHQRADVAHGTDVDLAARQEGDGAIEIDRETALDLVEDDAFDALARFVSVKEAQIGEGCGSLDARARRALAARTSEGIPASASGDSVIGSSGDVRLDRTIGVVLADIAYRFSIRPGFAFYDYLGAPNAWASPDPLYKGDQGMVLFGTTLLSQGLSATNYGDMFIMSVCAHEFGHIVQDFSMYGKRLRDNQPTSKLVELHADFLAGYYLGNRGATYPVDALISLGGAWESIGDTAYTGNPTHHGTPVERLDLIEHGYVLARDRPEFKIIEACEVAARYLGV